MSRQLPVTILSPIFIAVSLLLCNRSVSQTLPHLVMKGTTRQLIVHDKPFLILGGELGNSSASSLDYMKPIWPALQTMHLNTVLTPVYWELIEPVENKFDFSLVDSLIRQAERHQLKLVFLWFGSWKNSMSCYVPAWVKTNPDRFPRAQDRSGKGLEILSAFSKANLDADVKAYRTLMKHIHQMDKQHTVIMMQVENEIGMLTEAREYTTQAEKLFNDDVPVELTNYLRKNKNLLVPELDKHWAANGYLTKGSWETVFGKSLATDELFQAWYYARFTNTVTEAGKAEHAIPHFVNAALNHRHVLPGQYPSAGPLPHLMDIWQAGAHSLDFLSPDFYNPDYKYYNDLYTRRGNTLFIPEIRLEPSDGAKAFYAIGHYQAIGFSPFSIESVLNPFDEPVAKSYAVMQQLAPVILNYQGTGRMHGVLVDSTAKRDSFIAGDYRLVVSHDYTLGWSPEAAKPGWPANGGIIIEESPGNFIIAGTGIVVTFSLTGNAKGSAGILTAEEGEYKNGKWVGGRRMNGDQDHQGRHIRFATGDWGIQRVSLYQYK